MRRAVTTKGQGAAAGGNIATGGTWAPATSLTSGLTRKKATPPEDAAVAADVERDAGGLAVPGREQLPHPGVGGLVRVVHDGGDGPPRARAVVDAAHGPEVAGEAGPGYL